MLSMSLALSPFGFIVPLVPAPPVPQAHLRSTGCRMFEEPDSFVLPSALTGRGTRSYPKTGAIVITEGTGSFWEVRALFQSIHDFARPSALIAHCDSAAATKKILLSRQARYSGLIEKLQFADGDLVSAMTGAEMWLAINIDEAALPAQVAAAKAAGVRRAFLLLTGGEALDDA